LGIYKSSRSLKESVERLTPQVEGLVKTSRAAIDKTNEILEIAKRQFAEVDVLLKDASMRARTQMDRAELILDDTMNRASETVAMVHGGIVRPLKEINGLAVGMRAAIQYFFRGGRPSPDRATADEEMFI